MSPYCFRVVLCFDCTCSRATGRGQLEGVSRRSRQFALFAAEADDAQTSTSWRSPGAIHGDEGLSTFSPLVMDNIAYVAAKAGLAGRARRHHRQGTLGPSVLAAPAGRFSGIAGQRGANYWESKDRSDRRILVTSGRIAARHRCAHRQAGRLVCRSRKARSEDRDSTARRCRWHREPRGASSKT